MPPWIDDHRAAYIIAAYALAAIALIGLLATSLWTARQNKAELRHLKGKQ